ncbi:MAG TPA: ketoacyl-ACP synthase III [Bacteroidia bacterium]|nr:ketoacyl-ACP synthase III [Bacteroidia bacterium]
MKARISAIEYVLPEKIYTNEDFFSEFPGAKAETLLKTGVRKRHIAGKDEISSDLAFRAAEKLITENNIDRSAIDFLLFNSADIDYYTPATACVLQGRLGLKNSCGAMDILNGCSGYVYSLGIATGIMESMGAKNILLLNSSTLTRFIHPRDRANRFLFGDAAAASLITFSETGAIGPFVYGTDGKSFEKIIIRHGFARHPVTQESLTDREDEYGNVTNDASFYMDGVGIFLFSVRTVPPMINELLQKAGQTMDDVDLFVFHQPNAFLNEMLRKKLNIPEEKFVHCMADFGNTVQSTIPIALKEMQKQGRLREGMNVVMTGFGTGLSWAATLARF